MLRRFGVKVYVGGCQNYGPFLGTLNNRCPIIIGTQKGTIMLTTTHVGFLKGPRTSGFLSLGDFEFRGSRASASAKTGEPRDLGSIF